MKYQKRILEARLERLSKHFPAIVLTGARQVGKTTLLQHLLPTAQHITFDPIVDINNARQDPELFLNNITTPIILDEIQYTPELMPSIKRYIDNSKQMGEYWLTGSQNLNVLKTVSESLAGRAAILSLYPMSLAETLGKTTTWIVDYLRDPIAYLQQYRHQQILREPNVLYKQIWRGGYPGLLNLEDDVVQEKIQSYIRTYIERDIRVLSEISDLHIFSRFVQLVAHLTAQEINHSQLGRELGVTPQTAKRWLNVLLSTYQWLEIPAYSGNGLKRLSGKGKGYFMDTGLACNLMHVTAPQVLAGHPQLGALFESFVVVDIVKQLSIMPNPPAIYHWRAHSGAEVDLILEIDNHFLPIEIKCKSNPSPNDIRGIKAFRANYPHLKQLPGLVIAPVNMVMPLGNNCFAVPYDI